MNTKEKLAICVIVLQTVIIMILLAILKFFGISKIKEIINKLTNGTGIIAIIFRVISILIRMYTFLQKIFAKLKTGIKGMILGMRNVIQKIFAKIQTGIKVLQKCLKALETGVKDMFLGMGRFFKNIFSIADGERGDAQAQFKRGELEPQLSVPEVVNRKRMVEFEELLSRTTLVDASDSDDVWNNFLPSNSNSIAFIIAHSPSLANATTRKALLQALSDRPIIIDNAQKNFQLERKSGKNCYMLGARSLDIIWGDNQQYWNWTAMPDSRFSEVAELRNVCWLEIHGMINTLSFSLNTQYAAYLVFKMIDARGFRNCPIELSIGVESGHSSTKIVCLDPNVEGRPHNREVRMQRPSVRSDGWLEIEIGEFFNSGLEDEEVHMSIVEMTVQNWKSGFVVEGIEVRPK